MTCFGIKAGLGSAGASYSARANVSSAGALAARQQAAGELGDIRCNPASGNASALACNKGTYLARLSEDHIRSVAAHTSRY